MEVVRKMTGAQPSRRIKGEEKTHSKKKLEKPSKIPKLLTNPSLEFTDTHLNKSVGNTFLLEKLPQIVNSYRHLPWQKGLSIFILDIDDLTLINKQFGENVGNSVLTIVANLIGNVTTAKYFGRCGDDTFYCLLQGVDNGTDESVAQKLQESVKSYAWPSLAASLRVTCSIGVAQLDGDEEALDFVIRASIGLNQAKSNGRNCIAFGPQFIPNKQSKNLRDYYS